MTSQQAIEWISVNYSPENFNISDEQIREKLVQDMRYNFEDELVQVQEKLLSENPNFSVKLLDQISKEGYKRLIHEDVNGLRLQAEAKRQYDNKEKLSRSQKDILFDIYGISMEF